MLAFAPANGDNPEVLKSYLAGVDRVVDATPPGRNRVVDTWRVIALAAVVFGHWLAASIWVTPEGDRVVGNTLEWIPYAGWVTWIIQVMPVFFFVGGYANHRAFARHSSDRRSWLTLRFRRLATPAVPVIVVWTVLAFVLRNWVDADLVYAGVLNATIPLWFLAVYLMLIAIAPLTHRWWEAWGLWSVVGFVVLSIGVDVLYRVAEVPGIGWVNLVFVWGAIHQLGYWWASREDTDDVLAPGLALLLSLGAVAALVVVTGAGWYPVAMITIPGGGPQNVTPPTTAMILLGAAQAGIILATRGPVRRWAHRRGSWRAVVAVSGFIMTIYVWHLTALSLVIAIGLFTFDGVAFSIEPGTAAWWVTRPLFYVVLIAATGVLVVVFGVFERDIDTSPPKRPLPVLVAGMVGIIAALSATAFVYLVDREAGIAWWIPVVAAASAVIIGAFPASWRRSAPKIDTPA